MCIHVYIIIYEVMLIININIPGQTENGALS